MHGKVWTEMDKKKNPSRTKMSGWWDIKDGRIKSKAESEIDS